MTKEDRRAVTVSRRMLAQRRRAPVWSLGFGHWILIGIWVLGIWGFARADALRTLDGKTYDGEIRLDGGQSLHIVDKDGRNTSVKLSHLLDATFDAVPSVQMSRGVVLVDGTALAGGINGIGEKSMRVSPPGQHAVDFPIESVARVVFQPLTPELIAKAPAGSVGLLLKSGDFFEGQLRNYDGRSVRMESVLFGVVDFDTQDKAVALVLRPARELQADTIIHTIDGSLLAADDISFDHGQLKFNAVGIGPMSLPRQELADIHTGGAGRLISLVDLRPTSVEGGDPARVYLVDATNIGVQPRLLGIELKHAAAVSAGSSVTFALDGKYDVFTAKVGVPADVVPTGQLRFAVLVDGKEAASAALSSVDDPAVFSVGTHDARKLTLMVTAASPAASGIPGIWGDAQLLKHGGAKFIPAADSRMP